MTSLCKLCREKEMNVKWKCFEILSFLFLHFIIISGKWQMYFLKNEMCAKNTPMIAYTTITKLNGTHHILSANYTSTIPNGNNVKIKLTVFLNVREKWVPIFVMDNNNGACENLNKYARESFHDIQRRVKIKPGVCPIPPGTYFMENFILNINQVNFDTFPKGMIRLTARLIEKANQKLAFCYEMIMETK